jgi:hypothetical protein
MSYNEIVKITIGLTKLMRDLGKYPIEIDVLIIEFAQLNPLMARVIPGLIDYPIFVVRLNSSEISMARALIYNFFNFTGQNIHFLLNFIPKDFSSNVQDQIIIESMIKEFFSDITVQNRINILGWIPFDLKLNYFEFRDVMKNFLEKDIPLSKLINNTEEIHSYNLISKAFSQIF